MVDPLNNTNMVKEKAETQFRINNLKNKIQIILFPSNTSEVYDYCQTLKYN